MPQLLIYTLPLHLLPEPGREGKRGKRKGRRREEEKGGKEGEKEGEERKREKEREGKEEKKRRKIWKGPASQTRSWEGSASTIQASASPSGPSCSGYQAM